MKKYLILLSLLVTVVSMKAQYGPQAGDKSISLKLGKAEDFGGLWNIYQEDDGSYTMTSPSSSTSTSDNSLVNMIGVEGKCFFTSHIAARLSFMGVMSSSPSQDAVEGVSNDSLGVVIPTYNAVAKNGTYKYYGSIGADYYFTVKNERIHPYVGGLFTAKYARGIIGSSFDSDDSSTYDDTDQTAETYGFGGSVTGGVDYYIAPGMFIGFEVKVANYMYSVSKYTAEEGMSAMQADNYATSFLSNPCLKLGFTF